MLNVSSINPSVTFRVHSFHLVQTFVETLAEDYDLLLDCTDHPSSRYMISDLSVASQLPLISASALKTEGQLLVLNNPPSPKGSQDIDSGFCYRCVFPRPPPPESVASCGEGGILGPVVGVMGTLMATEAINILTSERPKKLEESAKSMLLYSACSDTPFRTVRLKGKRANCSCYTLPVDTLLQELRDNSVDYPAFCGTRTIQNVRHDQRLGPSEFVQYESAINKPNSLLIDVRSETEFGICHLPDATSYPLTKLQQDSNVLGEWLEESSQNGNPLFFICRYGNDSQQAVLLAEDYRDTVFKTQRPVRIMDIEGGLKAWRDQVDSSFPEY